MDTEGRYFIDFETRSFKDLTSTSYHNYFSDPTTSVLFMSYAVGDEKPRLWFPGQSWPKELRKAPAAVVVHNWNFEYNAFLYLPELQKAPAWTRNLAFYDCTMNFAFRWGLPGSLDDCAKFLGIPGKLTSGKDAIRKFSLPQKPKKKRGEPEPGPETWNFLEPTKKEQADFEAYGKQDIEVMRKIYRILPDIGTHERPVYALDKQINTRGIRFDLPLVRKLKKKFEEDFAKAEAEAEKVAGFADEKEKTLMVKSPKFATWLSSHGYKVPNCQRDTLEEISQAPDCPETVRDAIELRFMLNGAAIKKLDTVLEYADESGTVKHSMQYYGAHTGRWAGRGVQPHNFPRECFEADEFIEALKAYIADAFPIVQVPGVLKKMLRPLIIPPDGMGFLGGDLSAIEARVAFWLSDCLPGLDGFGDGRDIYSEFAERIPFEASAKGKELNKKQRRQIGKTAVLSLQYGAGAVTFNKSLIKNAGLDESRLSEKVVEIYRKTYYEIASYWRELEAGFIQSIKTGKGSAKHVEFYRTKTSVRCVLPSGREMNYFRPKVDGRRIAILRPKRGYVSIWGGVLLENIASAVARDILAQKMLELEKQKIEIVLSVHDEVLAIAKKGPELKKKFKIFSHVMNAPVAWMPGLPLKSSAAILKRYGK